LPSCMDPFSSRSRLASGGAVPGLQVVDTFHASIVGLSLFLGLGTGPAGGAVVGSEASLLFVSCRCIEV
jgi:hypothetical protein